MPTPTGITLRNLDVIIEISDAVAENTSNSQSSFGGGYVRQIGTLVSAAAVDDFVQYDPRGSVVFTQGGTTYTCVNEDKIYFIQAVLP